MIEGVSTNLRAPEMDDLERNHRWVNDREVTRFLVLRYPMALAAEESWMRDVAGKMMSFESAFFAIETKEGRHIGNTNLFNVQPENRCAELGIMIGEKDCWSRGFGSDALRTLLGFAFGEMNLHRVGLNTYAYNERGIACYRKVGFVEEGRIRERIYREGAYHDMLWMGVLRREWEETS
jgi:RimJ/RimL family protein N-acetyltransferase